MRLVDDEVWIGDEDLLDVEAYADVVVFNDGGERLATMARERR
jgi:hypothetical protein